MYSEIPHFHIDPTPSLPTRQCRILARIVAFFLRFGNLIAAAAVWWMSDWFFGIGTFLLGFIVMGILRSKMRNDSIPPAQREFPYNDYAIASWYLFANYCITLPKES
ncbi:MAG: hypothetical protein AB7S65_02995 [Sulfuricurvum sp.]